MKRTSFLLNKLMKEKREAALMTQQELANYCDLGKGGMQSISNIERGLCPVPAKTLIKAAKVLGISEMELIETHARDAKREMADLLGVKYE